MAKHSKIGTLTKKQLANELGHIGVKVSTSTIQQRLREKGIHQRKKSKKAFESEKNCKEHFTHEHVHWDIDQWKSVVWGDDSPFTLKNNSSQYVWRIDKEKMATCSMQGMVKHQKSINVWGCFSWNGVGVLHRVKGIMTGRVYRKILIHHLVPSV